MAISSENRAKALASTREAAAAFVEDMAHIREMLARSEISARELRHLSAVLRRLLVDGSGDLRALAPPRNVKLEIDAPDNSLFYTNSAKRKLVIFVSGGPNIFGLNFRALNYASAPFDSNTFNPDAKVSLNLDGFLNQKVIAFNNEWASRRDVIKYVANVAGGVHSGAPSNPKEILLKRIREAVKITPMNGGVKMELVASHFLDNNSQMPFKWSKNALDVVLLEMRAASHHLAASPSVIELEKIIQDEIDRPAMGPS